MSATATARGLRELEPCREIDLARDIPQTPGAPQITQQAKFRRQNWTRQQQQDQSSRHYRNQQRRSPSRAASRDQAAQPASSRLPSTLRHKTDAPAAPGVRETPRSIQPSFVEIETLTTPTAGGADFLL